MDTANLGIVARPLPGRSDVEVTLTHAFDASEVERAFGGWTQCIQLSSGRFSADVVSVESGAVRILAYDCNRGIELRRRLSASRLAIGLIDEADRVLEHGRAWDAHHVLVAGNGDVALTTLNGSRMRWIDIDLSLLSQPDRDQLQQLAGARSVLLSCENAAGMQLRAYVALMMHLATRNPGELGGEPTRQRIESDVITRSQRALEAGAENGSAAKGERKAFSLARRVEQFMWENVDEPLTLHQICKHMHCRMRSLIYSFKDSFGIGPITYLKILRLNAAHRKLRDARGSVRIFDIAASLGFWHMGHFSADYKRMFGMTATETVASARTNPRPVDDRFVSTVRGEV